MEIVPETPSIVGVDFSYRDWYRGVTATGVTYVSEAYETRATGQPLVVTVAAIVRDPSPEAAPGRPVGIVAAAYPLDAVRRFVNRFASTQGVAVTVTDQRGTVLAAPGTAPAALVRATGDRRVSAALQGRSGVASVDGSHGRELSAFVPVEGFGWTVTAAVPESVALGTLMGLRTSVLAGAGVLGLVMLGGLGYLLVALRRQDRAEEAA